MEIINSEVKILSKKEINLTSIFNLQLFYDNIYLLNDNTLPGGNLNYYIANEIINYYENKGLITRNTKLICEEDLDLSMAFANVCASRGYELYVITKKPGIEDFLYFKILNCKIIFENKKQNIIKKYFKAKDAIFKINLDECFFIIKEKIKNFIKKIEILSNSDGITIFTKADSSIISKIFIQEIKNSIKNAEVIGVYIASEGTNYESLLNTRKIYDDFYIIEEKEAYESMIKLLKEKNFYTGLKGAAVMKFALMHNSQNDDKQIIAIIPDRMERYFSLIQYYQI